MKKISLNDNKMAGLSLIELMVAMFVGLILVGGTASVYLASKNSYLEVERMARLTQNGRFAVQLIAESIIHAGYTGELPAGSIELDSNLTAVAGTDCTDAAAAYDVEHYMFAATSDANGDAFGCVDDAVPGTSVILMKNVRPMKIIDTDDDGVVDSPFAITGSNANNTFIMANNLRGIMFDGADTAPSIEDGGDIPGGSAWVYQVQLFYIRDNGTGNPVLSRKMLAWNGAAMAFTTEDLITGVESLSFLFGSDSNADGEIDIYRTAANVPAIEWLNIGAIQINVLVRSETSDPQYNDDRVYNLGGLGAIGPLNDNFHRMVMQSTVSLRNPKFVIRGNL